MELCAFILHLPRATARRQNAQELLQDCGLPGELWPAVDGAAMSSSDLESVVGARLFEPPYPFLLKAGEIGCFLSHRQIWAEILRRDLDCALVLEDDVALETDVFATARDLAIRHVRAHGYIQLQNRPATGAFKLIDRVGECTLTSPELTPVRASAQLISREVARLLLERSQIFDRPVDTYVQSHWYTGLRPAVIYPSGVSTISDRLDGSTIQTGRKTLAERLRREVLRFRYRRAVARLSRESTARPGFRDP